MEFGRLGDDRREQLLAAYRATTYRADVDGTMVELRIGEPACGWGEHSDTPWAFLSAANPGSQPLSDEENLRRHQDLVAELADRGVVVFPGSGVPDGDDWDPEISLLVLGISREEAVEIGREFGQVAIVYGQAGAAAELVEVD